MMMRLPAMLLIACVACSSAQPRLNPAIASPDPNRYARIQDAREWLNPYLSVCAQGVVIDVRSITQIQQTVQMTALRETLVALPVAAWPFGRVVALQDCSIGIPGDTDDRNKRMQAVEEILSGLRLNVTHWPS